MTVSTDPSSLTDADLHDALEHLRETGEDDDLTAQLVLLAWRRRLLSVRPAPVQRRLGPAGEEFIRSIRQLRDDELERRLRLARAT